MCGATASKSASSRSRTVAEATAAAQGFTQPPRAAAAVQRRNGLAEHLADRLAAGEGGSRL
jgi:hypothetical protein